jgi:hypothetical protein
MAALASYEDLSDYLGVTFDDAELVRASMLLDMATAVIRSYTGQTITAVDNDSIILRGDGTSRLFLPEMPVRNVDSVTEDGVALIYNVGDVFDYRWTAGGVLFRLGGTWGTTPNDIVVVYDHGYVTVPEDIRAVCVQVAARAYDNPHGYRSESIGSYSYSAAIPATGEATGMGLSDGERDILGAYRPTVSV